MAETGATEAGITETDLTWEASVGAAGAVLAGRPTAILCFNDVLAAGLMVGLRRLGVTPGRDVAVVGLDDLEMAQMVWPPLTSVAMHPVRIGASAARLLTRRLADADAPVLRECVAPELRVRDSSGCEKV